MTPISNENLRSFLSFLLYFFLFLSLVSFTSLIVYMEIYFKESSNIFNVNTFYHWEN